MRRPRPRASSPAKAGGKSEEQESGLLASTGARPYTRTHVRSYPPQRHQGRADPACASSRRRGRARRSRPRAGPRRVDRRLARRARRGERARASSRRSPARLQDQRRAGSRRSRRAHRGGTSPDRRSTASAWRRAPATSSTATTEIETAARSGKVHLLLHAADARRGREPQRSTRPGGSAAASPQGVIFPRGTHYLVDGTGARKCGTCRPDRSRRRFACPTRACPVASFHWPDRGPEGGEPALRTGSADEDLTKE